MQVYVIEFMQVYVINPEFSENNKSNAENSLTFSRVSLSGEKNKTSEDLPKGHSVQEILRQIHMQRDEQLQFVDGAKKMLNTKFGANRANHSEVNQI